MQPVAYQLVRKRMKTIRLTVAPDGETIRVSAPWHAPRQVIDEFVASKQDWIERQRQRVAQQSLVPRSAAELVVVKRAMMPIAQALVRKWAPGVGVPEPRITLREMKSRWGSCSMHRARISLNTALYDRDPKFLEYVVVHELVHFLVPDHGAKFQAHMDRLLPDWRDRRRALNGDG